MAALLNNWKSFAELDTRSKIGSHIDLILSTADFVYLAEQAIQARAAETKAQLPAGLVATLNHTQFMSGRNNLVLEITFSDGVVWLARVHMGTEEQSVDDMLSEITTMRVVRERTTIPVPKIYAFDATSNNNFGFPYMFMERLAGRRTRRGLAASIPVTHRPKVAKQIANILVELSQITFDRIGRLITTTEDGPVTIIGGKYHYISTPMKNSLDYFYGQRYGENLEVYEEHQDDARWNTACWILTTGLSHVVIPDLTNGPFSLSHQDLHFGNLLFDDDFNISGVIDWSSAQVVPLEELCVLPDFIFYKEEGGKNLQMVIDFKNLIVQALEEAAAVASPYSTKARHLATFMASDSSELASCLAMKMSSHALDAAEEFRNVIYGTALSWEQLIEIYGKLPAPRAVKVPEKNALALESVDGAS